MKKIFVMAGELSGDQVGAWYLKKYLSDNTTCFVEAVGGEALKQAGAQLYARYEALSVTGIFEIVRHLPFILNFLKKVAAHILEQAFDEVILIDFPGFNLRLAKLLKKKRPTIQITYLSPPQVWCWGAWRVHKIKNLCDRVIVLYPFEVAWYAKHCVKTEWLGSPVSERLNSCIQQSVSQKKQIALIAGSRLHELENLFPFFAQVVHVLIAMHPELEFIIPRAESISQQQLERVLEKTGLLMYLGKKIHIIQNREEKLRALAQCCVALSKPGTITLELALLCVPTVVAYRTSWATYLLARTLVKVEYMALPNLFLNQPVFQEFIQANCTVERVSSAVSKLYQNFLSHEQNSYQQIKKQCDRIKMMLQ